MLNKKIRPPTTENYRLSPKLKWQEKVTFTPSIVLNFFIIYEWDRWSQDSNTDFTLKDCLFGAVKLTKNSDQNKFSYFRYGIGFDLYLFFSFPNFDWSKNVIIFGVDNSSSVHI